MKTPKSRKKTTSSEKAGAAIRRILVPTDFSEASKKAIAFVRDWPAVAAARITLLHVIQPIHNPDMSAYALLVPDAKLKRQTRELLEKLALELRIPADRLESLEVREGIPFDQITKAAVQAKSDAIVICTHGYTGLKRVMLGSTTERVVRHARCPVLVVPATT